MQAPYMAYRYVFFNYGLLFILENGFVEYDEFLTMMKMHSPKSPQTDTDQSTMEAFKVFDMDGNGYIDKYELKYVFRRLGLTLSDDDIKAMFQEADTNNDGFIDFSGE